MLSRPLRLIPQTAQAITSGFCCPLCGSQHAAYVFGTSEFKINRCAGCALTFSEPRRAVDLEQISGILPERPDQNHFGLVRALLAEHLDGHVLLFADPAHGLESALTNQGVDVIEIETEEHLAASLLDRRCSAAIVSSDLMRVADPVATLSQIRAHLEDGAPLLLSMPLLDRPQARLMKKGWHEWRVSNRWYFTAETLQLLLLRAGFGDVWFEPERRVYSLDELDSRFALGGEATLGRNAVAAVRGAAPATLRAKRFPLPSGTAVVSARAVTRPSEPVVSIVVPVFNEASTFGDMMEGLIAKPLPGLRKEIIVVESNSTDGSRALVEAYSDHPDVRVILQPGPRGKGNAVREGLSVATGDIIMIQDADLEYDFDDYDGLLAPLLSWQTMFVLGTRHQGSWKVRKFSDAPVVATLFNLGHWFFQTLINLSLNTRMSDPFTMFKIFRRDALFGVDLVCNRFDLDIELVMKLVRKNYNPLEIAVNYASRSFSEGKKVSLTRDGMTWIWTIVKFRFAPLSVKP